MLLPAFITGWGMQGVWLMTATMNADVCDEDELVTGHRREGMYGAVFALEQKIAFGVASGLGGLLAVRCGYTSGAPKSPEVLVTLKHAFIITQVAFLVLAAVVIAFYPLTRARQREVRRLLDERHAARQAAPLS
jgi:Na+/melibiose symporter-like transporter